MHARTQKTSFNIRRATAMLAGGAAFVVGVCIAVLLTVISISSASVDAAAQEGARKLLDAVIGTYQRNLSNSVTDYATWDDVYKNFMFHRQPKWEHDNLGPNITKHFDTDFVAVVSRDGDVVYSFHAEESNPLPLSAHD